MTQLDLNSVNCRSIGDAVWDSVHAYAGMAGRLPAPESFVQSTTAMHFHQTSLGRAWLELPFRTFVDDWGVQREQLRELGTFRVDVAIFDHGHQPTLSTLNCLLEFKLWTNRFDVRRDVDRIKHIIGSVQHLKQNERKIRGYVAVCPQYMEGLEAARLALKDFRDRFPLCYERTGVLTSSFGTDYGIGVAVVDVNDCIEGMYG